MDGITYQPGLQEAKHINEDGYGVARSWDMIPTPRLATSAMLSKSTWLKSDNHVREELGRLIVVLTTSHHN